MIDPINYIDECKTFSKKSTFQEALILKLDVKSEKEAWTKSMGPALGNYFYKSKSPMFNLGPNDIMDFTSNIRISYIDVVKFKDLGNAVAVYVQESQPKFFKDFETLNVLLDPQSGDVVAWAFLTKSVNNAQSASLVSNKIDQKGLIKLNK